MFKTSKAMLINSLSIVTLLFLFLDINLAKLSRLRMRNYFTFYYAVYEDSIKMRKYTISLRRKLNYKTIVNSEIW